MSIFPRQTQGKHLRVGPARVTASVAALVAAAVLVLLAPVGAPAATVTPRISVGAGYDDNIRLLGDRNKDYFLSVTPGLELETGQKSNRLIFIGDITYTYYLNESDFTGVERANLMAGWTYQPSPNTTIELRDKFTSSYDPVYADQTGGVVKANVVTGRRDSNVASVRLNHRFGPQSSIFGGYSFTTNDYERDPELGGKRHDVNAGVIFQLGSSLLQEVSANASRDDFKHSDDIDRVSGELKTTYVVNQAQRTYMAVSYSKVMSDSPDPVLRKARDYEIYALRVGYMHQISRIFDWEASVGYSRVEGDPETNEMAGSGYPTGSLRVNYRGEGFFLMGYAEAYLGEYGFLGDNTGLTATQRFGVSARFDLARHWDLFVGGDYIRDSSQQNPEATDTLGLGDVNTILFRAGLGWQITENARLGLNYRYLRRDAENDDSDLDQNRVMLLYTHKWPNKW